MKARGGPFLLLATLVWISGAPTEAGRAAPLPFDIGVLVEYGAEPGPESVRDQFEDELHRRLLDEGCFASVQLWKSDEPPPGDLLLRVVIDKIEDETEWDISLAGRYDRRAPPDTGQRRSVTLEADVRIELRVAPETFLMDHKRIHKGLRYRPLLREDPRRELLRQYTELVSRKAVEFACGPPEAKLRKMIDEARANAASGGSGHN